MTEAMLNSDTQTASFVHKVQDQAKGLLDYYTQKAATEQTNKIIAEHFFNLPLKDIFKNLSVAMIDILNDLFAGQGLASLFKGDRIIYLGILSLIIGFCLYVIDITG